MYSPWWMIISNNSYCTIGKKVTAAFLWFGHEYSLGHFVSQKILMVQQGLLHSINILSSPLGYDTIFNNIIKNIRHIKQIHSPFLQKSFTQRQGKKIDKWQNWYLFLKIINTRSYKSSSLKYTYIAICLEFSFFISICF